MLLSYSINENTPIYGNGPKPGIEAEKSMEKGDSCNSYKLSFSNHSGTHVDAPAHFTKNGKKISEYSLEELLFKKVCLVEVPKTEGQMITSQDLKGRIHKSVDCIIIRTGFCEKRNSEEYVNKNPGIASEAMEGIRKNFKKVRCIGIDTISISSFTNRSEGRKAHHIAFEKRPEFGEPLLIIEDMNLKEVNNNVKIKKITIVPWLIECIDSAPCSILGEVE